MSINYAVARKNGVIFRAGWVGGLEVDRAAQSIRGLDPQGPSLPHQHQRASMLAKQETELVIDLGGAPVQRIWKAGVEVQVPSSPSLMTCTN